MIYVESDVGQLLKDTSRTEIEVPSLMLHSKNLCPARGSRQQAHLELCLPHPTSSCSERSLYSGRRERHEADTK
jgi:hypothetical protein